MKGFVKRKWNSESRMRENRLSGLMRGGSEPVIGLVPFNPSTPAYSTIFLMVFPLADSLHHRLISTVPPGPSVSAAFAPLLITPPYFRASPYGWIGVTTR